MAAVAIQTSAINAAAGRSEALRAACDELVGMTMFGQLLRQARQSSLNSDMLDSAGQRIFRQQLDDLLVQQASGQVGGSIGEALYRQITGEGPKAPLDIRA